MADHYFLLYGFAGVNKKRKAIAFLSFVRKIFLLSSNLVRNG